MTFEYCIKILVTLFVITEPLGTIPIFLALTDNIKENRKKIAKIAAITSFIVMIICQYIGKEFLLFFGVSIDAFRIAGGILLIIVAFEMINARLSRSKHSPKEDKEATESDSNSLGVVPLGLPLLVGPGAMSTIIVFSEATHSAESKLLLSFLLFLGALMIWLHLHFAELVNHKLSVTGMNVITRVMGLILASMAVEFIITGIRNLLPGLA